MGDPGIINGYASLDDLRDYDGTIIQLDIWNHRQPEGEILNVDVWPLVGVGVGLVGARAHIGPLGAGLGTLFYKPEAQDEWWDFDDDTKDFEVD